MVDEGLTYLEQDEFTVLVRLTRVIRHDGISGDYGSARVVENIVNVKVAVLPKVRVKS
jgi:hypothetical protein